MNSPSPLLSVVLAASLAFPLVIPRAVALEAAAVINEIQYHPAAPTDPEWIELRNRLSIDVDLTGWQLTGGANFTFPTGTVLKANGFLVLASNPAALQSASGITGVLGPWSGNLSNAGESLRLRDLSGRLMDEVSYNDSGAWPVGPDGSGSTLSRRDGHLNGRQPAAWAVSRQSGGTPGTPNEAPRFAPPVNLFPLASSWRYLDNSPGLPQGWQSSESSPGTDGWLEGPGLLGFSDATFATPIATSLSSPGTHPTGTYYFQKSFTITGDPAASQFSLELLADDGAVIYVNGTEVGRPGMPATTIAASTAATSETGNAEPRTLTIPSSVLRTGPNTISTEVHQAGRLIVPSAASTGLTLVQTGGPIMATNFSRRAGATAFARDVIPAAPTHSIAGLNNGTYGNASSWIGNSLNSFCGISFGTTPVTLGSVAWGRDNTGQFTDRCAGTYTLEYTTVPTPNAATPNTAWTTIGSVTYPSNTSAFSIRRVYNFTPVEATGIRLRCPGNSFTDGSCIDELEAGPTIAPPAPVFKLMNTGGTMASPANMALSATAFAKDVVGNGSFAPTHTIRGLNDGLYGNPNSWIGNSTNSFAGIAFPSLRPITRIAFGRDNTGSFADRAEGLYTIQFTTTLNPTNSTPDAAWTTIGTLVVDASLGSPALRHLIEFPTVSASGIRIITPGSGVGSGACIDELEIYGPQPPDVVWGASLDSRFIIQPPAASALRITEISGASDPIWKSELTNTGASPVDISAWILADSNSPLAGFSLPALSLAPGESLVLDQSQLGFRPALGDHLFLFPPDRSGLADAVTIRSNSRARDPLGRMLAPSAPSFGSPNTFSLSDAIVISEIMYNFPGSSEEWIELLNRSAAPVDLSGWQLDDAVSFSFPPATILQPGARIVVARDATALTAKWPGISILGNFSGNLSNSGERILLKDAAGNPADEVSYATGGQWPALADGGGASLELIDPDADNNHPSAWTASDESSRSSMQTFSYRMASLQQVGPSFWNEIRLGLLDAGVCLIDDLRVTRDPDGAAQELVRNSSFDSTASWRLLGNHAGSSIITDGPNGSVLRLAATGPAETNHNHAESTYVGNIALVNAQSYQVSFRARWISGCPKVSIRSYYSRIARIIDLPIPSQLGSPGAANPKASIAGPALSNLRHEPVLPAPGQSATIRVDAADPRGIASLTLHYRTNADFTDIPMTASGSSWSASIPPQPAGTIVQFHVSARNLANTTSFLPAAGPAARALYLTDDGQRATTNAREFRVLMQAADSSAMLSTLNLLSNATTGATLIVGGSDVFYNVGIRLQGSAAGRARDGTDYQGFNIDLNPDQPYLGIYESVGFDRSGRAPANRRPDEIYAKHLFHRAGLPCTRDDLAHLVGPTTTYSGTCILQLNGYNAAFARDQFDTEGSVFNFDGTYEPTTTTDGNPESFKNPTPFTHHQTDLTDLGPDKEHYRGFYDIRVGKERDDYSPLIGICQSMALTGTAFETETNRRIDPDQWMRTTALANLLGVDDSWFTGGFPHNARFFVPTTGKAILLPWDMDFLLNKGTTAALNLTNNNLRKLTLLPANNRAYLAHVRDLCLTALDPAYVQSWLTHYGSVTSHNYSASVDWLAARRTFALSQLPASVPFAITTNSGADFSVAAHSTSLAGTGWLDIASIRRRNSAVPLAFRWTGTTTWSADLPLVSGPNAITLDAFTSDGTLLGSVSLTITDSLPAPLVRDFLRIAEIHYNPAPPVSPAELAATSDNDDFEFIELLNTGTESLDLTGVQFTDGIRFAFAPSTLLPAGARIALARNPAAFSARYGPATTPVGPYAPDNLSNAGETITLVDAAGTIIQSISYDDAWAPSSDGAGHSLVLRNPANPAAPTAAAWALGGINGSPGNPGGPPLTEFNLWRHSHFSPDALANPAISGPSADSSGEGIPNLLRYASGLTPSDPAPPASPFLINDAPALQFIFRQLSSATDLTYSVQSSSDLSSWTPVAGTPTTRSDLGNGIIESALPLPNTTSPQLFRLSVQLRP